MGRELAALTPQESATRSALLLAVEQPAASAWPSGTFRALCISAAGRAWPSPFRSGVAGPARDLHRAQGPPSIPPVTRAIRVSELRLHCGVLELGRLSEHCDPSALCSCLRSCQRPFSSRLVAASTFPSQRSNQLCF